MSLGKRELTRRQAKLVRARVMDPHATLDELGLQAGYAGRSQAWRAMRAPAVVDALSKVRGLMDEREKLSLGALLTHLENGLEATGVRSVKLDGTKLKVSAEVKDFGTRHKYLTSAFKLWGLEGRDEASAAPSGPLNLAIILAGGGTDEEKIAVADILLAARRARGLHELENRMLTPQERVDRGMDAETRSADPGRIAAKGKPR